MTDTADVHVHNLTSSDLAGGAWTLVCVPQFGVTGDLLLETGRSAADLRTSMLGVRRRVPDAALVVVVAPDAPVELVVTALDEGADTCVRGYEPAAVHAHLSALYRRRLQRVAGVT